MNMFKKSNQVHNEQLQLDLVRNFMGYQNDSSENCHHHSPIPPPKNTKQTTTIIKSSGSIASISTATTEVSESDSSSFSSHRNQQQEGKPQEHQRNTKMSSEFVRQTVRRNASHQIIRNVGSSSNNHHHQGMGMVGMQSPRQFTFLQQQQQSQQQQQQKESPHTRDIGRGVQAHRSFQHQTKNSFVSDLAFKVLQTKQQQQQLQQQQQKSNQVCKSQGQLPAPRSVPSLTDKKKNHHWDVDDENDRNNNNNASRFFEERIPRLRSARSVLKEVDGELYGKIISESSNDNNNNLLKDSSYHYDNDKDMQLADYGVETEYDYELDHAAEDDTIIVTDHVDVVQQQLQTPRGMLRRNLSNMVTATATTTAGTINAPWNFLMSSPPPQQKQQTGKSILNRNPTKRGNDTPAVPTTTTTATVSTTMVTRFGSKCMNKKNDTTNNNNNNENDLFDPELFASIDKVLNLPDFGSLWDESNDDFSFDLQQVEAEVNHNNNNNNNNKNKNNTNGKKKKNNTFEC